MSRVRVLLNSPINRPGLHRHDVPPSSFLLSPRRYILRARALPAIHPPPRPPHRRRRTDPVVVVVLLFFTTARLSSRAPPRSSFTSSSGSAKFIAPSSSSSTSSYLERSSVRPSGRSSEVRKYRLVCPMTRRLLLQRSLASFFPA